MFLIKLHHYIFRIRTRTYLIGDHNSTHNNNHHQVSSRFFKYMYVGMYGCGNVYRWVQVSMESRKGLWTLWIWSNKLCKMGLSWSRLIQISLPLSMRAPGVEPSDFGGSVVLSVTSCCSSPRHCYLLRGPWDIPETASSRSPTGWQQAPRMDWRGMGLPHFISTDF